MNEHCTEKKDKEKTYSISEMDELVINETRKKAEPRLQIIASWLEKQGYKHVEDILVHPILVVPMRVPSGKYYMQVILDGNDISIVASIRFDSKNIRRVNDIVSKINSNEGSIHLGYAHAFVKSLDDGLNIKYLYDINNFGNDVFNPDKHFAKYWNSIKEIAEYYYIDVTEDPEAFCFEAGKDRPRSVADKFFAQIQDVDISDLNPIGSSNTEKKDAISHFENVNDISKELPFC